MNIPSDTTTDAFLGGALVLVQPRRGYRAGIDPVLLAATVAAKAGDHVLDLGCGAGAAGLCLAARVKDVVLKGLEVQPAYAALARINGAALGGSFEVFEGAVQTPPATLKQMQFDHVLANPPYYDRMRGNMAPDQMREIALGEAAPLKDWVRCASKRLKPKGHFYLILKADRLADALRAFDNALGSPEVLPIAPRAGKPAELIILRARKEGRTPLKLHAPLILHQGSTHPGDSDHYTKDVSNVLRCGAPIGPWSTA